MIDAVKVPEGATLNDSFDILTAGDFELLMTAKLYLERVKAHPRLVAAVTRAALRLLESNGEATCRR